MRGFIGCAAALAALLSGTASAEVVFHGTLLVSEATAACQSFHAGDNPVSVYHPRVEGNANFSGLTIVRQFGARGFELDGADFTAAFKPVTAGGIGWSPYSWTGAQVRVTFKSSVAVAGTRFVSLRGQIKKPNNNETAACVITFEASYTREPD